MLKWNLKLSFNSLVLWLEISTCLSLIRPIRVVFKWVLILIRWWNLYPNMWLRALKQFLVVKSVSKKRLSSIDRFLISKFSHSPFSSNSISFSTPHSLSFLHKFEISFHFLFFPTWLHRGPNRHHCIHKGENPRIQAYNVHKKQTRKSNNTSLGTKVVPFPIYATLKTQSMSKNPRREREEMVPMDLTSSLKKQSCIHCLVKRAKK